ncbi:hypothetical protein ACB094_12G125700 [Castanea mollissima]
MAIAMDHVSLEVDHSGYGCDWQNRASVVDWECFQLQGHDDFQDLIESMMEDGGLVLASGGAVEIEGSHEESHSNSNSNSNSSESTDMVVVDEENDEDYKGLKLVHLLIAAAEALNGSKSRDLAGVILVRLKEMVSSASTDGTKTSMERLAAYFTEALQGLLESAVGVHKHHHHRSDHSHSHRHSHSSHNHNHNHNHNLRQSQTDILTAFQLLQDMSPYVSCGIRVHIVDYDIMEGIQWASLMQALVSRKEGPPGPHLRITAITRGGTGSSGRRSIGTVQETGRRLIAFAASIGQPFSFHQCRLDSDETFRPSVLKLVRGESLVVNCMLNLPHFNFRAPDSVSSFLSGAKSLNPRIVTPVEEELGTGPVGKPDFLGRFMDTLHHYSAVYDSLEAGFPMQSRARALVERVFLGPRISGSLARIYCNPNHCQAKLLLSLFNDGYRAEEVANNKIVLGRKLRRLLSASVWTTTSSSDSDY